MKQRFCEMCKPYHARAGVVVCRSQPLPVTDMIRYAKRFFCSRNCVLTFKRTYGPHHGGDHENTDVGDE